MSIQNLTSQRDELLEQLGHCIDYISHLENSIDRLGSEYIYEDMTATELDFDCACELFDKLNKA